MTTTRKTPGASARVPDTATPERARGGRAPRGPYELATRTARRRISGRFGERLRFARQTRGLSQMAAAAQWSDQAPLGANEVCRIELNRQVILVDRLPLFTHGLQVGADYFLAPGEPATVLALAEALYPYLYGAVDPAEQQALLRYLRRRQRQRQKG